MFKGLIIISETVSKHVEVYLNAQCIYTVAYKTCTKLNPGQVVNGLDISKVNDSYIKQQALVCLVMILFCFANIKGEQELLLF